MGSSTDVVVVQSSAVVVVSLTMSTDSPAVVQLVARAWYDEHRSCRPAVTTGPTSSAQQPVRLELSNYTVRTKK